MDAAEPKPMHGTRDLSPWCEPPGDEQLACYGGKKLLYEDLDCDEEFYDCEEPDYEKGTSSSSGMSGKNIECYSFQAFASSGHRSVDITDKEYEIVD